jgi:hypothetical protein
MQAKEPATPSTTPAALMSAPPRMIRPTMLRVAYQPRVVA